MHFSASCPTCHPPLDLSALLGCGLGFNGGHALRHACASRMLAQGLSLKEIGDHLGHSSTQATTAYAKVDMTALRAVAAFDLGGVQ